MTALFTGKSAVVTGGSRGIGLAVVEALQREGAHVTVVARNAERLEALKRRLGVDAVAADVAESGVAASVLERARPDILVLSAAAQPALAPLHEQSWEGFSASWNTDVKATLFWVQQALRLPLPRGARVLLTSSGAAIAGSPLSGGYAGSKRMIWFMAQYANASARELAVDVRFQALVPRQIVADTEHGRPAAEAYAKRRGVSLEAFLASFGAPLTPTKVAEYVISILSKPEYLDPPVLGLKGDGIGALDA